MGLWIHQEGVSAAKRPVSSENAEGVGVRDSDRSQGVDAPLARRSRAQPRPEPPGRKADCSAIGVTGHVGQVFDLQDRLRQTAAVADSYSFLNHITDPHSFRASVYRYLHPPEVDPIPDEPENQRQAQNVYQPEK